MGALAGLPTAALGITAWLAARRLTGRQPPDSLASPSDFGLAFENVSFRSSDGVILRGWFIPSPANRGAIILCPGHTGSMDPDLEYAPAFHARGYHVLMFDFRGHGRSGGEQITLGYHERRDLLATIDFLRRRGVNSVGLLGFSMGANVAMITAPLSPAVRAVVSDSGFATLETSIAGWMRHKGAPALVANALGALSMYFAGLQIGHPISEVYPIRWVDLIAPRGLFIVHGGRDVHAPASDAQALYERAGEPKEIWIQPDAGHR